MLCSQPQSSVKGQVTASKTSLVASKDGWNKWESRRHTYRLSAAAAVFLRLWVAAVSAASAPFSDVCLLCEIHSQLEGSLSQWTSYQEDSRQFVAWMERVEESLDPAEKQCPEMRDKTANLSKAKVRQYSQSYCVVCVKSCRWFIWAAVCSATVCVTPPSLPVALRGSAESQHPAGNHHRKKCQYLRELCVSARAPGFTRALQRYQRQRTGNASCVQLWICLSNVILVNVLAKDMNDKRMLWNLLKPLNDFF